MLLRTQTTLSTNSCHWSTHSGGQGLWTQRWAGSQILGCPAAPSDEALETGDGRRSAHSSLGGEQSADRGKSLPSELASRARDKPGQAPGLQAPLGPESAPCTLLLPTLRSPTRPCWGALQEARGQRSDHPVSSGSSGVLGHQEC